MEMITIHQFNVSHAGVDFWNISAIPELHEGLRMRSESETTPLGLVKSGFGRQELPRKAKRSTVQRICSFLLWRSTVSL
jgi:hypothetical protein